MASLVLGVCGKKRSGKDSFASRLVSAHGFTRIGFADALKDVALDLDPWIWVEPDEAGIVYGPARMYWPPRHRLSSIVSEVGWEKSKETREVRRILQYLGVAVRDHVSDTAWVDAVARQAAAVPGPVVITDVRFPNEADWIKSAGGKLARIHRPDLVTADQHISETALDHRAPDFYVSNGGTLEDLYCRADTVARTLMRHAAD